MSILRSSKSFQEDNREEAEEVGGLERAPSLFLGFFRGAYFLHISQMEKYTPLGSFPSTHFSLLLPGCPVANLNWKMLARAQSSGFRCQFGNIWFLYCQNTNLNQKIAALTTSSPFGRPTNAVHTLSAHKPYMIQSMNDQKVTNI